MRKLFVVGCMIFGIGIAPQTSVQACGDKFVGATRATRFQQAPSGHQESILVYANPASDIPLALARVSVDSALRRAGYRPKIVTSEPELKEALEKGNWDMVVLSLTDTKALSERAVRETLIIPVALHADSAQLDATKKQYRVIITKPAANSDSFVRIIYQTFRSRTKGKTA